MLIIEGPDGSGKTTLAHHVAKELGLEYRRPSQEILSSETGPRVALIDWWKDEMRDPARNHRVYDRCFYISEAIYQLAQPERKLMVNGDWFQKRIQDLWAEGPLLIFCLPPFAVQLSNVIEDGRASLKGLQNAHLEKIDFLYWAYFGMWVNSLFEKVTRYDYTADPNHENIMSWLGEWEMVEDGSK